MVDFEVANWQALHAGPEKLVAWGKYSTNHLPDWASAFLRRKFTKYV